MFAIYITLFVYIRIDHTTVDLDLVMGKLQIIMYIIRYIIKDIKLYRLFLQLIQRFTIELIL